MADNNDKKQGEVDILDQLGELVSLGGRLLKKELRKELKESTVKFKERLTEIIDEMKEELKKDDEEGPKKA